MRGYIFRRFLYMLVLLAMGTVVSFLVITLPPGDYMTAHIARLKSQGGDIGEGPGAEIVAVTFGEPAGLDDRHSVFHHLDIGAEVHTGAATGAQPLVENLLLQFRRTFPFCHRQPPELLFFRLFRTCILYHSPYHYTGQADDI